MEKSATRYLCLLVNDEVVAVALASCQGASQLIMKLFDKYSKSRKFVSLVSNVTHENLLGSPAHYHLGVLGGNANVFCCVRLIFKSLAEVSLRRYGLVAIPSSQLFPEALHDSSSVSSHFKNTMGANFKI